MKKLLLLSIAIIMFFGATNAQTAMQISGVDCYDNPVDMFADLDAGKAIILHFYMPDCGSCPPPATKIQTMANTILETYPGMIKAYAFPFQNSTDCDYSISWVEDNHLELYAPMDSGALPVAYYGGFGMPTIVLLGGADHRVMFSTLSFNNSDTTEMADSILALFGETTGILDVPNVIANMTINPNPAVDGFEVVADMANAGMVDLELFDVTGNLVYSDKNRLSGENQFAAFVDTQNLTNGLYLVRLIAGETTRVKQVVIAH